MNAWAARVLLAVAMAGASCEGGCESPVPKTQSVHVRGTADPGVGLVKMVNRGGLEDRTASVGPDGRYDFTWTGADLTGFFGERSFILRAPASPGEDEPSTESSAFVVRADMDMPHLGLWNAEIRSVPTPDGGLDLRWRPVQGQGFRQVTAYHAHFAYDARETTETEGRREVRVVARSATIGASADGISLSPSALASLLANRCSPRLRVSARAEARGTPVDLEHRSATVPVDVRIPADAEPHDPHGAASAPAPSPSPRDRDEGSPPPRRPPVSQPARPARDAGELPWWVAYGFAALGAAVIVLAVAVLRLATRRPPPPRPDGGLEP